ncbi:general odorant-binding protein 99b-like [Teleopsis dalmanni]|uniref:general odorant-binding protein 99b n=1 Tax=Teleopsis dalmanni TaxID=139649 RepID=UPI0018CF1F09|nr:general odorant-binding protein 99b [Teleopsis dalmanni]XP_037952252.1 general odorant-binding protein 99b-like [Teleopsis dalmanni]
MKAFIAILLFAALASAHHHGHVDYVVRDHSDLVRFREHCSTTLNVPAELVEKYKVWNYPDDEVTRCYMKCVFEQFGFFDAVHGFDVQKIHHQLAGKDAHVDHNDAVHGKIEHCADKNTQGSDACTWAYRGGMCFIKENLQLVKHSVKTD